MIFITIIELFGLNERVIKEVRGKVEKKFKTRFGCFGTVAFVRKVNLTIFILRGRHEGIANVETYTPDRDSQ